MVFLGPFHIPCFDVHHRPWTARTVEVWHPCVSPMAWCVCFPAAPASFGRNIDPKLLGQLNQSLVELTSAVSASVGPSRPRSSTEWFVKIRQCSPQMSPQRLRSRAPAVKRHVETQVATFKDQKRHDMLMISSYAGRGFWGEHVQTDRLHAVSTRT